jgi:hypothetical protein
MCVTCLIDEAKIERKARHRAASRGFQIVRLAGREGRRRETLGIAPFLLIDRERVHLFAASFEDIFAYLANKPEIISPLHDDRRIRLTALGLIEAKALKSARKRSPPSTMGLSLKAG